MARYNIWVNIYIYIYMIYSTYFNIILQVLVHHYTNYMPWILFDKSEILLVSVGSELVCYRTDNKGIPNCNKTMWKLDVPKVMRHDVRTNDISRFVMRDSRIVCGNRWDCNDALLFYHIALCHLFCGFWHASL